MLEYVLLIFPEFSNEPHMFLLVHRGNKAMLTSWIKIHVTSCLQPFLIFTSISHLILYIHIAHTHRHTHVDRKL